MESGRRARARRAKLPTAYEWNDVDGVPDDYPKLFTFQRQVPSTSIVNSSVVALHQVTETLACVPGFRRMTGRCKCRGEDGIRTRKIRIDRDRPTGPLDRLIVLLQQ